MKKGNAFWALLMITVIVASIIGMFLWQRRTNDPTVTIADPFISELQTAGPTPQENSSSSSTTDVPIPTYTAKQFDLAGKIKGLSASQISQHITLYNGYVQKMNEIEQKLATVDRQNSASRTYSPFRSLKIAETYALNGSILHELYFENLSIQPTTPDDMGPLTKALIEKSFGSIEAFKKDFFDSAGVARGWVLTSYGVNNGLLHNYVLDEHNIRVPVMVIPLIVLDVYEHAYMIDYGINRKPYLQVFWEHIDWVVVENRVTKWVEPFGKQS